MNKTVTIVLVALLAVAIGFGAGFLVAKKVSSSNLNSTADRFRNGPGAVFAQLTQQERDQLQNMTPEQRQQFFKDKGIDLPQGFDGSNVPSGTAGARGFMRGGGTNVLQGTVASAGSDKMTIALANGGSVVVYIDGGTIKAAAAGAKPELVQGAKVYVVAQPEAQGVTAAKAIIVE